jgi:hypothetical protein
MGVQRAHANIHLSLHCTRSVTSLVCSSIISSQVMKRCALYSGEPEFDEWFVVAFVLFPGVLHLNLLTGTHAVLGVII